MVWFQCEDCGDNLKKPKLANHFRQCSAFKLSCIDCGQVFGQQDVESHTQCITESEKYGPKGQGKATNGTNIKTRNDTKQKPEVDINVGLSERPPWFCRILCNTKTTSKQTLLLHADGKKHRAKARAFHSSKQQPNNDTAQTKGSNEKYAKDEVPGNKDVANQNSTKVAPLSDGSGVLESKSTESNKKRKLEASENGNKTGDDISTDFGNGEIRGSKTEVGSKRAKHSATQEHAELDSTDGKDWLEKKIQWKKLITSALKSNEDGAMKLKKLRKFVVKSLKESGFTEDRNKVSEMIEQKVNKFKLEIHYGRKICWSGHQQLRHWPYVVSSGFLYFDREDLPVISSEQNLARCIMLLG
ncbi:hypothetical protein OROGR_018516 [Orobanche gracilis]